MSLIDVSELLEDPDFVDPVTIVRTSAVVGVDGMPERIQTLIPDQLMSVQPASGQTITAYPELTRSATVYEVWGKMRLYGPQEGTEPDRIIWRGRTLAVNKIDDYSHWGQGYYHCVCSEESTDDAV